VVDYRDGSEPAHVRELSGLTRFGNVSLRRGMTTCSISCSGSSRSSPAR
jgi:hypothetical protein